MDFCKAFVGIKIKDDDYHLIVPLITKVLDAVSATKDVKESDQKHRLH